MVGSLLLLLGAVGVSALSAMGRASHQVYSEALVAAPGPSPLNSLLDPTDPVAAAVGALSQPGLLRTAAGGREVLALAASWREEDGGSRYAFTLPRAGRWSDGRPITTRDVAFTLAVLQAADFPQTAEAEAWSGVSLYASSFWDGTFVLPSPTPDFAEAADVPILPEASYHDLPQDFLRSDQSPSRDFVPSAGPFAVTGNGAAEVSLGRNPYFTPLPQLSEFVFDLEPTSAAVDQLLARGRVDGWLAATPSELGGLPAGLARQRMTTYSFVALLLNQDSAPLGEPLVRQALAAAVDRRRLIRNDLAGLGEPEYGPLPVSIPWARLGPGRAGPTTTYSHLLEQAGYRRGGPLDLYQRDGKPLSLSLTVPALDPLPTAARGLAAMLTGEGILVTVQVAPSATFVSGSLASGQFQLAMVGFDNGPNPDLTAFWGTGPDPGKSMDYSQAPADPLLSHDLEQLAAATTSSAQAAAYRQASARLNQDLPAIFLYTPVAVYVHLASVRAPGIPADGDPSQRFQDVAAWSA